MLSKTEILLLIFAALAFFAGAAVEAFLVRMRKDGRGLIGGLLAEARWIGDRCRDAWRGATNCVAHHPATAWIVTNLDRYAPVLATRTGGGALVSGVAGKIGIVFPWLNVAPEWIEIAVSAVCVLAMLYGFLRTLYGRRHAGGEVAPRTTDVRDAGPRPAVQE